MAIIVTGGGGGARIGVLCAVSRGDVVRASDSGGCEHCYGDQYSRQKFKFNHLISPLHLKSQQRVAHLWKWSRDRRIKVTISSRRSTQREVERVVQSCVQLEVFKAN
jgi:hypothetical protein